jgi:hypothetical protein
MIKLRTVPPVVCALSTLLVAAISDSSAPTRIQDDEF